MKALRKLWIWVVIHVLEPIACRIYVDIPAFDGELKINNRIDPSCKLYHGDKYLGHIRNEGALLNFQSQVHEKMRKEGRQPLEKSGYYVIMNGERFDLQNRGVIKNICKCDFYSNMTDCLNIIMKPFSKHADR